MLKFVCDKCALKNIHDKCKPTHCDCQHRPREK